MPHLHCSGQPALFYSNGTIEGPLLLSSVDGVRSPRARCVCWMSLAIPWSTYTRKYKNRFGYIIPYKRKVFVFRDKSGYTSREIFEPFFSTTGKLRTNDERCVLWKPLDEVFQFFHHCSLCLPTFFLVSRKLAKKKKLSGGGGVSSNVILGRSRMTDDLDPRIFTMPGRKARDAIFCVV